MTTPTYNVVKMAGAISFKKLVEAEDNSDDEPEEIELEDEADEESLGAKQTKYLIKKRHASREKTKLKIIPRIFSSCRISSWVVAAIALATLTAAIVISTFLTLAFTAESHYGAVAADSTICSEMGGDILQMGGSAVDAAITTMLCVGMVNPESSGIGGGGFMTIFDPSTGEVKAINFREKAPEESFVDMFDGQSTEGGLSVGVPGEVAGMKKMHELYGKLEWAELFQPVIDLGINGYPLTEHTYATLVKIDMSSNPKIIDWYYTNGILKSVGDIVRRPGFADVLELIAKEGIDAFYNGSIAEEMVDEVMKNGGILSMDDLIEYNVMVEDPIYIAYKDYTVYAPPLPSGGPQMLFMVNVMENMNLTPSSPSDNVVYQHLVETFKYSFAARSYLGDPYCAECDNQSLAIQSRLISELYASFINASISNNRTFPPDHYNSSYFVNDKGTAHISIVDGNGMAVSVTTTVGGYFGSKLITKSGIVLNNQLDGFSAPNITNIYHLKPFKSHFVLPGKRPLSSTCPSIVLKRDRHGKAYPYMVIGGAGGTFIGTATAQAILRVLSYEESITEAIEAPRLHSQLYPDVVSAEDGYPTGITSYLRSLGHTVVTRPLLSELQGIIRDSDGILTAHSDSRKGGNPLAFVY